MTNQSRMANTTTLSLVHWPFVVLASSFFILGLGCFPKPNKANIALRREIQSMQDKVADLEARDRAHAAQVAALQANRTIPTLPSEKLQRLYTASGIKFKNLNLGQDLDPSRPGDEGFKIAVAPIDQFGDEFKSAGAVKVELFDLSQAQTRLGSWSLDTPDMQERWLSTPVIDAYVMTFSWQTPPTNSTLLVKVTFTEELTGRVFEAQTNLNVQPPEK